STRHRVTRCTSADAAGPRRRRPARHRRVPPAPQASRAPLRCALGTLAPALARRRGPGAPDQRSSWAPARERGRLVSIMSTAAKDIIEAALKLDPADRVKVAHELLDSIDGGANGGLDAEWIAELEQRARDIEEGRTDFVSWPEARQEIEDSL